MKESNGHDFGPPLDRRKDDFGPPADDGDLKDDNKESEQDTTITPEKDDTETEA